MNKKTDLNIKEEVNKIRNLIVAKHAPSFPKKMSSSLNESMNIFSDFASRKPFDNTTTVVQFTNFVADHVVSKILKNKHYTLLEKILLVNRAVELSAREFLDPNNLEDIIEHLSIAKQYGYFFTPYEISHAMLKLGQQYCKNRPTSVIDPACGAGMLLAITLLENKHIKKAVGVEIDAWTANIAKRLLNYVIKQQRLDTKLEVHIQDGTQYLAQHINCNDSEKFDFLIMNPPYGRVRHISSSLTDNQTLSRLGGNGRKLLHNELRKRTITKSAYLRQSFKDFGLGKHTPEYSKLFLSLSPHVVKKTGSIVAITPAAWLADKTGAGLRKLLLSNFCIHEVWTFRETAKFFDTVNQPTAITCISPKMKRSSFIKLKSNMRYIKDLSQAPARISVAEIATHDPQTMRIPKYTRGMSAIFDKVRAGKQLKTFESLINARGEFDLTLYKKCIADKKISFRLIRGDHIERYFLKNPKGSKKKGYVNYKLFKAMLRNKIKANHISSWRIACPQCSYQEKQDRLEFALLPPKHIVANSCNYILVNNLTDSSKPSDELLIVLAILNSAISEWEFRCFSANNHVGNYELAELHFPTKYKEIRNQILPLVRELTLEHPDDSRGLYLKILLEVIIAKGYSLSSKEFELILTDIKHPYISEALKYFKFHENAKAASIEIKNHRKLSNHNKPSLSVLDAAIISYIPQGGNWRNVPEHIPSKRLDQIREMSKARGIVRTSYYGRLRPDQPAYTIATYFNRPGNGTNIHPWEERTISCREAARLQSFPDDFIFHGSEASVRKQIGNAVPPLLAYAVGRQFVPSTCIDLFSGAGGLSHGLTLAGMKLLAAQDIDKNSALTYSRNHSPSVRFFRGDLTNVEVQKELINYVRGKLGNEPLGLLAGGAPCQGFSTAGWRQKGDHRNSLVGTFLDMAEALKPNYILLENVEGILSMGNGTIIASIQEVLGQLGYVFYPKPWILKADKYGVPQMRKRVFVIACKRGLTLPECPSPIFLACKGRLETKSKHSITSRANSPYPITVAETFIGLPQLAEHHEHSDIYNLKTIRKDYNLWVTGKLKVEDFLEKYRCQ